MAANLSDVGRQAGERFQLVNVLPATALVLFAVLTALSGAFTRSPSFAHLREGLEQLGLGEIAVLLFVVFVIMLVLNSFQAKFVKLLEGYWRPVGMRMRLLEHGLVRHAARRSSLDVDKSGQWSATKWHTFWTRALPEPRRQEYRYRNLDWANDMASLYPPRPTAREWADAPEHQVVDRLMPTRLGNALRRAEDFAGDRFGLDAITVVPYLMAVASDQMRSQVEDAQTEIDVTAKFVYVWGTSTALGLAAFINDGPWLAIPVITMALSYGSYIASVYAAEAYGGLITQLVDLYRFDLMNQLHWRLPSNLVDEIQMNDRLWRRLGHPKGQRSLGEDLYPYKHPIDR